MRLKYDNLHGIRYVRVGPMIAQWGGGIYDLFVVHWSIRIKDTARCGMLFSERHGYGRGWCGRRWYVRVLSERRPW